jgi:crescentin
LIAILRHILIQLETRPMSEPQQRFITICPRCSSALKVRRVYLGQMVACKQCSHSFVGVEVDAPIATMTGSYTTEPLAQHSQNGERIQVVCDNCEATLNVKTSRIGQVISCKQCGGQILINAVPKTQPKPALVAHASTSGDDLIHLAAGRGSPDKNHEPLRSRSKELQTELEMLRVAHCLLETELTQLQPAYDLVKAENKRLSEQIDLLSVGQDALRPNEDSIAPTDARAWHEEQGAFRAEIEGLREMLNLEQQNHQTALNRRTAELDRLSEQHRALQDRLKSAEASCTELQGRNEELVRAQARLESDLRSELESQRRHHGEVEDQLRLEQQNHQAELIRRTAELDRLSEQHRVVQDRQESAEASCTEHRGRNEELVQAQARLESDFRSQLESHRCRQSELEEQIDVERQSHQAELIRRTIELDELSAQHRAVQDRLTSTEASCNEHQGRIEALIQAQARLESDFRSQLESHACRTADLGEQLRVERQTHQAELIRRTNELDELSAQHRAVQDRLTSTEASCNEHQGRNEELVQAQARLESDFRSQLESHRCRQSELEEQIDVERQSHQAELIRRTDELDELREQHRVLQGRMNATEAGWKEYQESNQELFETQAQLETAFRTQLESDRCRQAELEEELRTLRAELATRAETVSGNVALEPVQPDQSSNGSARDDELATVRTEMVTLRRQFGDLERLYLQLRNGLNGLGIRVDLR